MRRRILSLFVFTLALAFGTSAVAQKTNIDWDRSEDFTQFHTYGWQKSPHPAKGLWDQRIIDGVNKQLQAKGLKEVQSDPDVWVVYSNSIKDQKEVVGTGYNMGPSWGWGPWGYGYPAGPSTVQYNTYVTKEGTLVVELADAKTHQLLWRGSATATISDNSNKNIKTLDSALNKLFKNYPPKPEKK